MNSSKKRDYLIPEQEESNPYALFVSLYLVVLAFFILLNSISDQNKVKTEGAVASLAQVFSSEKGLSDLEMQSPTLFDYAYIVNDYLNSVEGLMTSSFQLTDVKITRSGNRMKIVIPSKAFFAADAVEFEEEQKVFLAKLKDILIQEVGGSNVSIDFIIDSYAFNGVEKDYSIDIARVMALINYLVSSGVPADLINGGVAFNDQKNVTIKIHILEVSE